MKILKLKALCKLVKLIFSRRFSLYKNESLDRVPYQTNYKVLKAVIITILVFSGVCFVQLNFAALNTSHLSLNSVLPFCSWCFVFFKLFFNFSQRQERMPELQNFFGKFSPGFHNFLHVFISSQFQVHFQFQVKFKVKTVLNSIKT